MISIYGENITGMYFNLKGEPIKRTPFTHPYSYDEYVKWMGDYHKDKSHAVYSDRLFQWDHKKYNQCCEEVFGNHGQYFDNREPSEVNQFLNLYFGKEVKLTAILQGCNVSSGFPYWCFIYEECKMK